MKISYKLTLNDIAVYYQFYLDTSPTAAEKRRKNVMMISIYFLIVTVLVAVLLHNFKMAAFCVVAYFISMIWYLKYGRKVSMKGLRKIYSQPDYSQTLGMYTLESTKKTLNVQSPNTYAEVDYSDVQNIAQTQDYVFLLMGPFAAYIIPRSGLIDGDLDAFVKGLKKRLKF